MMQLGIKLNPTVFIIEKDLQRKKTSYSEYSAYKHSFKFHYYFSYT